MYRKLTQYCEPTILQYKIKIKKRKKNIYIYYRFPRDEPKSGINIQMTYWGNALQREQALKVASTEDKGIERLWSQLETSFNLIL